ALVLGAGERRRVPRGRQRPARRELLLTVPVAILVAVAAALVLVVLAPELVAVGVEQPAQEVALRLPAVVAIRGRRRAGSRGRRPRAGRRYLLGGRRGLAGEDGLGLTE